MDNERRFYTYAYLRADGTPYYIGKGQGKRAFERKKRKGAPTPEDKSRILFLKTGLTEKEAFKHEIYMIAVFGRKDLGTGILRNLTDGGEGTTGWAKSEEMREKMIEICKKNGRKTKELGLGIFGMTPEDRSEVSKRSGKKGGAVAGKKAAEMKTGIHSPEHKYSGVEVNRRQGTSVWDPEVREKSYAKTRKPVELTCLTTGKMLTFRSAGDAAKALNLNRGNLCSACRGVKPKVGGYTARYLPPEEFTE
jgi:hypothetical protein